MNTIALAHRDKLRELAKTKARHSAGMQRARYLHAIMAQ